LLKSQKKPLKNIRFEDVTNIDVLQNKYYSKAETHYKSDLIDCEVAILSKTSKAVREIIAVKQKSLNNKNQVIAPFSTS